MFTLWYTVLSWKEYSPVLCAKFNPNCPPKPQPTPTPSSSKPTFNPPIPTLFQATPIKPDPPSPTPSIYTPSLPPSPVPPPSRIPVIEPAKSRTPSTPSTPIGSSPAVSPQPPSVSPLSSALQAPTKPPRSPSPHPLNAEAFESIDFEDDEESEPEDENSIIASDPWAAVPRAKKSPLPPTKGKQGLGDFLQQEIAVQKNQYSRWIKCGNLT